MLSVTKKPKTYHGRVNWYASDWQTKAIEVFNTKTEAVVCARRMFAGKHEHYVVCVDWIPAGADQSAITRDRTNNVLDRRTSR